ncbi:MAG: ArsA family ATPase, partial [Nitrososphaera sp.]
MRLIIYTGKGGTGKTVTSCATGLKLARRGHRTLVLSADPAHTLADAFMMPEVAYEPRKITENLVAQQIDPVTEMSKQYNTILAYMASV